MRPSEIAVAKIVANGYLILVAVGLGYLPAQDQADPRSARLGREERDEEIPRVRKARTFVVDPQFKSAPA